MRPRIAVIILISLLVLVLLPKAQSQAKKTVIDGDGELILCMPLNAFLEGPGKLYTRQPYWGDPQLKYATVYTRPDFWRGKDYLIQVSMAVAFLQDKLVAIIREANTQGAGPTSDKAVADLRRQLFATYNVPFREDVRYEVFGKEIRWLTFTDGQGNRIQLEVHLSGGILNILAPFRLSGPDVLYVRLSYLAAGFPPSPDVKPEQYTVCSAQPSLPPSPPSGSS